jgi:hypothetical protein
VIAVLPDGQGASWESAVLTDNTVHLKANCLMANRPIREFRLGPVKAANWLVRLSRRDSIEPLRPLNVPGGIRTCDFRFRNS